MKKFVFCLLILGTVGCITTPRVPSPAAGGLKLTPPVTAPNPALVASCQSTQNWHNALILLGSVLGGSSGVTAAIDTSTTNQTAKNGIDIGAAIAAGIAATSTVVAGFEANTFAQNNCENILLQNAEAAAQTSSP